MIKIKITKRYPVKDSLSFQLYSKKFMLALDKSMEKNALIPNTI